MNEADREILSYFISTRENTIAMLDAVGDEMLSLTPEGEDHNLAWQFAHIASGVNWWMEYSMGDGLGPPAARKTTRQEIEAELVASRDRLVKFFTADDGEPMGASYEMSDEKEPEPGEEWVGRNRVLYLTSHELHHLGRIELAIWQAGLTDTPTFP